MRAVLDTNIVIDLLHFADPNVQALRTAIGRGVVRCFTDQACLSELQRVCAYPQLGLDPDAQQLLLKAYLEFVTICEADGVEKYPLPRCRDADDQKFLILGVRCRADLLLTRDRLLLALARRNSVPLPYAILTAEAAGPLLTSA